MHTLLVEGWRFLPHSYAMVNQNQCLELLQRPGIRLFHRDLPFAKSHWQRIAGLWPPHLEAQLQSIPAPPPGLKIDAVLRMGFPHFFHSDPNTERTFTFGTTEMKALLDEAIGVGLPAQEVLPHIQSTLITSSAWSAKGFLNSGAPAHKVKIVPHGVDTRVFAPANSAKRAELRKKFGWEGRFVLLNVGAMSSNKGVDLLLRAAAALSSTIPHLLLALKGSDQLFDSQKLVADLFGGLTEQESAALSPRMAYLGDALSVQELADIYQAADVYVAPYRAEGFNLPVLEAVACGLPVICTQGGSTDEFTSDEFASRITSREIEGPGGRWFLEPDPRHLMELVSKVAADRDYRERCAQAGPAWATANFTWRHAVDRLLRVLLEEAYP